MKSIPSRPVLALNFYFPSNEQPSIHFESELPKFGVQPYKNMIKAAN